MKSIGKYDQHDRLKMCIGGGMDENVHRNENVPSLERKRPRFRATSTKMSYIPIKSCQVQGRKRPKFQSARYEKVPDSDQQGRKRPRFQSARTKTLQIPIQYVWSQCDKVRFLGKYAKKCG